MNQDDVILTVSAHVGQTDSSRGIIKKDIRELVEIVLARDVLGWGKPLFAQTLEPQETIPLGHQRVRQAISREIDETHIGIGQLETGEYVVGLERLPGSLGRGLEEPRQRTRMYQEICLAIAAHVAKSHSGLSERDAGGDLGHGPRPVQQPAAEVSPVTKPEGTAMEYIGQSVAE
ncbi:MAG: hypothetical protein H0T87_10515 [Gammaproteobacteria bacterium]|nr:hypothetical protein [Gammaproteobacteria bacterium]